MMIEKNERIYCARLVRGLMSTFCVVGSWGALIGVDKSIVGLGSLLMASQPLSVVIKGQPTSPTVARTNSLRTIKSPPKPAGQFNCVQNIRSNRW
jgi:hypothetical protein